jgi:UDP-N-acetylglucosamine transferase subunit ALG13
VTLRVFVTVGTDHHRFDRLLDWVDDWAADRADVELIVQHGSSRQSRSGTNHVLMTSDDLARHYGDADIVIAQVGPGTISDANQHGLRPVVVPRDPDLDEVVDGHQFEFGDFMAKQERCWTVTDERGLRELLDQLCDDPPLRRVAELDSELSAIDNVSRLTERILSSPSRRGYSPRKAMEMARAKPRT